MTWLYTQQAGWILLFTVVLVVQSRRSETEHGVYACSGAGNMDECANNTQHLLRSGQSFDFKHKCLFCATDAKLNKKKRGVDVFQVRTLDFKRKIIDICNSRGDEWARCVLGRLQYVNDLPAADAIYHQTCNVNFRTNKEIPKCFQMTPSKLTKSDKTTPGRPVDTEKTHAFNQIIECVQSSVGKVVTVNELVSRMEELCGEKAYSSKHMKNKLIDYFGSSIVIGELDGKSDTVTLKATVASIIHDVHKCPKPKTPEEEKTQIIKTAAKLIKNDILSMEASKVFYPSSEEISSVSNNVNFLPPSLKLLLEGIFSEKDADLKLAAVGQAIVQACKPKGIISPLQLGLGVQMHHHFGSRFLVDTLCNLGFSVSYREVQKFELNAAAANNMSLHNFFPGSFVQFVADNVDHNSRTLDGYNTFHGMGIIACTTPARKVRLLTPRTDILPSEIAEISKIDIKYFKPMDNDLTVHRFENLSVDACDDHHIHIDLLSKVVWTVRPQKPAWSGFMQLVNSGTYPGQSSITFLPMIDMNPSDMTCINTTLWFVVKQAERYGITPIVTFDQPLFLKSTTVINSQPTGSPLKSIVLRLGGFHTQMSFLGSIGHLMMGSGLQELLETIYSPNAVLHMMSGKAVSRAVRGHFLVDTALHALLMNKVFGIDPCIESPEKGNPEVPSIKGLPILNPEPDSVECQTGVVGESILEAAGQVFDKLESHSITVQDVYSDVCVTEIEKAVKAERLSENRTSQLWFQYMDMVSILQQFLRAERTGNWNLHLDSVNRMLPYFAASGHHLYLKSAYIYLQNMLRLKTDHPDVYQAFRDGHHVIRRSDRFWAGLSTDLIIEQVLMRSVKTTGGLTRGRGMTELQRAHWLLSMPACSEMNSAMQTVTGTEFKTSEQHKEVGTSRKCRDTNDTQSLYHFLKDKGLYVDEETVLQNIDTGVSAEPNVNVDKAASIGKTLVLDMVGQTIHDFSFKKSKVIPMNSKSAVKLKDDVVHVEPQLLFQRLTAAANRNVPEMSEVFKYELCSMPSSLFEKSGLPRLAQKAVLAETIWNLGDCSVEEGTSGAKFVLDGGSLIQRIPWDKNTTFGEICQRYLNFVQQKYPSATIIFDGYSTPSIKDVTHVRRTKGRMYPTTKFRLDTPFRSKKDIFLCNETNKQNFINLLGSFLTENGQSVILANDDADTLVVQTAIQESQTQNTVVIGEDTDLLVLLCCHAKLDTFDLYFRSDIRRAHQVPKTWYIQKTKRLLGEELSHSLPFLHALTGCDSTSHIYGISKGAAIRLYMKNSSFRQTAETFNTASSHDVVVVSGEHAIIHLHSGIPQEGLNLLRFRKFSNKVLNSSVPLQVHSLPPTSAAAMHHSLRVYLQTQVWLGNTTLSPLNWGWKIDDGKYVPVKTDLPPAPDNLMKIIRCNCKQNCDTKRCTCRKHGLDCSPGCGACRGDSCSNSPPMVEEEEDV